MSTLLPQRIEVRGSGGLRVQLKAGLRLPGSPHRLSAVHRGRPNVHSSSLLEEQMATEIEEVVRARDHDLQVVLRRHQLGYFQALERAAANQLPRVSLGNLSGMQRKAAFDFLTRRPR